MAPVAWQLDVRGLQRRRWQGDASTGQLPVFVLYQPQLVSDHPSLSQAARSQPQLINRCVAFGRL